MKRKEKNNILLREKNGQFKFLKQSCDPYLRICQHCLFNENNVMRRGPDGRKNLCNACGLFWKRTGKLKDLSKGGSNLSIDQSDLVCKTECLMFSRDFPEKVSEYSKLIIRNCSTEKIESVLSFLDKDIPSSSEVDHSSVVGISR